MAWGVRVGRSGVGVRVASPVGVSVGLSVGVGDGVWVEVAVGVLVGVGVAVGVGVGVKVPVAVAVSVSVAVWLGVKVAVGVGLGVAVGAGLMALQRSPPPYTTAAMRIAAMNRSSTMVATIFSLGLSKGSLDLSLYPVTCGPVLDRSYEAQPRKASIPQLVV